MFSLNTKYNSKKKRVKISAALQKETQADTQQTHKAIDEDRRLFLQAVAVRIMKMRKQMLYNVLVEVSDCELASILSYFFSVRVSNADHGRRNAALISKEIIEQSSKHFKPNVTSIKKCIEVRLPK